MCAALRREELEALFLPYDLKRLEMYSRSMVDYHLIMDMIPAISRLYFLNQLGDLALSAAQSVGHLPLVCGERGGVCGADGRAGRGLPWLARAHVAQVGAGAGPAVRREELSLRRARLPRRARSPAPQRGLGAPRAPAAWLRRSCLPG